MCADIKGSKVDKMLLPKQTYKFRSKRLQERGYITRFKESIDGELLLYRESALSCRFQHDNSEEETHNRVNPERVQKNVLQECGLVEGGNLDNPESTNNDSKAFETDDHTTNINNGAYDHDGVSIHGSHYFDHFFQDQHEHALQFVYIYIKKNRMPSSNVKGRRKIGRRTARARSTSLEKTNLIQPREQQSEMLAQRTTWPRHGMDARCHATNDNVQNEHAKVIEETRCAFSAPAGLHRMAVNDKCEEKKSKPSVRRVSNKINTIDRTSQFSEVWCSSETSSAESEASAATERDSEESYKNMKRKKHRPKVKRDRYNAKNRSSRKKEENGFHSSQSEPKKKGNASKLHPLLEIKMNYTGIPKKIRTAMRRNISTNLNYKQTREDGMKDCKFRRKDDTLHAKDSSQLVVYDPNRETVLSTSMKRRRNMRAKVHIDAENERIWPLLEFGGIPTDFEDRAYWANERSIMMARVDIFILTMRNIQGRKCFSPWKGSIVDSVVGAFLTQNVSDHLSSSAFMSLVSRYPAEQEDDADVSKEDFLPAAQIEPLNDHKGTVVNEMSKEGTNDNLYEGNSDSLQNPPVEILEEQTDRCTFESMETDVKKSSYFSGEYFMDEDQNVINGSCIEVGSFIRDEVYKTKNICRCLFKHTQERCTEDNLPSNVDGRNMPPVQQKDNNEHNDLKQVETEQELIQEMWNHNFEIEKHPLTCSKNENQENEDQMSVFDHEPLKSKFHLFQNNLLEAKQKVCSSNCSGKKTATARKKTTTARKKTATVKVVGKGRNLNHMGGTERAHFEENQTRRKNSLNQDLGSMMNETVGLQDSIHNGKKVNCRDPIHKDSVNWEAVRMANVEDIVEAVKERGMHHVLGGRIKAFLKTLCREHGNIDLEWLRKLTPENARAYLMSIHGLGVKSVECIRLLTLHHIAFPVDVNVGRICVRLGWVPIEPLPEELLLHQLELYPLQETVQKYLWPRLCKLDQKTLYEFHYQLITFGKVFCTKTKPNCNACPMRNQCKHFASACASAKLQLTASEHLNEASDLPVATDTRLDDHTRTNCNKKVEFTTEGHPFFVDPPASPKQRYNEDIMDIENLSNKFKYVKLDAKHLPDTNFTSANNCLSCKKRKQCGNPIHGGGMHAGGGTEAVSTADRNATDNFEAHPFSSDAAVALLCPTAQGAEEEVYSDSTPSEKLGMPREYPSAIVTLQGQQIPIPKLKNIRRLGTVHHVYELPDNHSLLEKVAPREKDDPSPYLLAIWSSEEILDFTKEMKDLQKENESYASLDINSKEIVRGTLLIPCRTAMKGSFPLNGTYFQINEVFADHESSINPLQVPRSAIWMLTRRYVSFGTTVSNMFRGLPTSAIASCLLEGYICVRGFDRRTRAPKPLAYRLHTPISKRTKINK